MNLLNFNTLFPDEASCKVKWKKYRDKQGVVCPRCNCQSHYWKKDKENYECKGCSYRQSLRSNTVMHGSQLPFRYWFIAIHLLTSTRKSFSASELQRQLGHSTYNPIWAMLHKLRQAMGVRDASYRLTEVVELDEEFFSTETPDDEKDKSIKRGRGSQKKSEVLVMAESIPVEGSYLPKGGKPRKVRYIKMFVIEDLKSSTLYEKVVESIECQSMIDTDNSNSYTNFKFLVKEHRPQVISPKEAGKLLPWVHIAISNAKRMFLDIFHDIKPEYLQSYMNEFCYKFNRRYFGENLFDRLMIAAVTNKNQFRYNIE